MIKGVLLTFVSIVMIYGAINGLLTIKDYQTLAKTKGEDTNHYKKYIILCVLLIALGIFLFILSF